MELLYGKPIADEILRNIGKAVSVSTGVPHLAVILVGEDPASHLYVSLKEKEARRIGIEVSVYKFSQLETQDALMECVKVLNEDEDIHGIIVQLPLPENFDTEKTINAIRLEKDVDGFHPHNVEVFKKGEKVLWPVFPHAIVRLMESVNEALAEKRAIVVANSHEFGEVMKAALEINGMSAGYILSGDLKRRKSELKYADVVVTAVGVAGVIKGEMLKSGAIVIDGGIAKIGKKIVGDVDPESVADMEGFVSPVPGGVGPLTIACLLENVYLAFVAQQREKSS